MYSGSDAAGMALFGLDPETGASAPLTEAMEFAGYSVWSPDGSRVAFLAERDDAVGLFVLEIASGSVALLMAELGEPVDFSPDGSAIVFMDSDDEGGRRLVIRDLATGTETVVDTGSSADAYARWSAADNALVFESARDGNPEIYRHELDTGLTTRLTDNPALDEWPAPSRNGQWIAWAAGTEADKNLWVMRADGTEKRQLTSGVLFGDAVAAWSPDDRSLLLSARDEEGAALYLVSVDSGEMTRVTAGMAATWR